MPGPGLTSESLDTVRVAIEESGALGRPKLAVPDSLPEGIVRVDADGTAYHAPVEVSLRGDLEIRGLYDNARLARTGDGENHLPGWVDDEGLEPGRSAHLDVVVEGEQYGLRAPGERAVYDPVESPDESLASIAEDVDG